MMDYNNPNDPWMHTGYDPYKGMDDDDRMLAGCLQMAGFIGGIVIAFLLCLLFSSCTTTQYVPVIEHKMDTLIVTKHQHDSIHVHDSIYVRDRGDTVWIERWHTKYVERLRTDTLIEHRADTVAVPVEVEVEVPRQLTWWQQTRIHAGEMLFVLLAAAVAFAVWRLKRK